MRQDRDAKQGSPLPWQWSERPGGLGEGSTCTSISSQAAPGRCKQQGQGTSSELKLSLMMGKTHLDCSPRFSSLNLRSTDVFINHLDPGSPRCGPRSRCESAEQSPDSPARKSYRPSIKQASKDGFSQTEKYLDGASTSWALEQIFQAKFCIGKDNGVAVKDK